MRCGRPDAPLRCLYVLAVAAAAVLLPSVASAHFPILTADPPATRKGVPLNIDVRYGHPFEGELQPLPAIEVLEVLTPGGVRLDLRRTAKRLPLLGVAGQPISGLRLRYTPTERGDALVTLRTKPRRHGDAMERDHVKLILHCQTQNGWERRVGGPVELLPLTRPYGLFRGIAFRAQLLRNGKPAANVAVEVEHLSASPPDPNRLPPEERITRVERTDPNGCFTTTLPETGWWVLGAEIQTGTAPDPASKTAEPLRRVERAVLWVHVD